MGFGRGRYSDVGAPIKYQEFLARTAALRTKRFGSSRAADKSKTTSILYGNNTKVGYFVMSYNKFRAETRTF